jgi:hypothetical protein
MFQAEQNRRGPTSDYRFLLSRSSPASAQSGSPGLVAAYSFDEGTGNSVADLSGNNINGTVVGATWIAKGMYGNALAFNGISSYVDLGNRTALRLTGSMTIEAWVKTTGNPADDGQIVAKSDPCGWQLKTSPDTGPHTFVSEGATVFHNDKSPKYLVPRRRCLRLSLADAKYLCKRISR